VLLSKEIPYYHQVKFIFGQQLLINARLAECHSDRALLVENDEFKDLIVAYRKKLSDEGLLTIYAFVIVPN